MITKTGMLAPTVLAAGALFLSSAALAAPAGTLTQTATSAVSTVKSTVTPGVVGNTVQVGVGPTRIGSTNGLAGPRGTPTTAVGVSALTQVNPPQGSVATVSAGNAGSLLGVQVPGPK